MHGWVILMHMRTTINIDRDLLARAAEYTGIKRKTDLVAAGLESLVRREAMRRLAAMGGSLPGAKAPPRRRAEAKHR